MQRKFFSRDELVGMDSVEKLIVTDSSHFSAVSSPSRNLFNTLHGTLDSHGFQGSFNVYRYDSDAPIPIKRYDYWLSMDSNGENGEIKGPFKTGDRYFDDTPDSLGAYLSEWIIERWEEFKRT